jgi:glycyl-tRNA synthetase
MCNAYREEKVGDNDTRVVLALPPVLAPVKAAILPLTKKDGLPELARKIFDDLKLEFNCVIEEKDSIGRRYRRQDANGTPFCVTVDNDTHNDNCVTIRHRDSMQQERVSIEAVRDIIDKSVSMRHNLLKC